jgi:hypothetical protein
MLSNLSGFHKLQYDIMYLGAPEKIYNDVIFWKLIVKN